MPLIVLRSALTALSIRSAPTAIAVAATLAGGVLGFAPHQAASPLAGTWTLVAADRVGADGIRKNDYGANPHGRLIVDAAGRYSLQIFSAERPIFAAGDKTKGTPAEYAAAVLGMSAHFGTCTVDEANHILRFRIERSAYKNWEGTEQERHYELKGDTLSYQVPASASGNGSVAISVWRRVP